MRIGSRAQEHVSVPLGYAGVMAGSDIITMKLIGYAHQFTPFDMTITQHTGIGCPARHVLVDEILYDTTTESVTKVHYMMFKSHPLRIMLCLHDGIDGATAFLFSEA